MLPFEKYILYIYFFFFSHPKVSLFDEKRKDIFIDIYFQIWKVFNTGTY